MKLQRVFLKQFFQNGLTQLNKKWCEVEEKKRFYFKTEIPLFLWGFFNILEGFP